MQVETECNLIRIQLLVLVMDGNPSKFHSANGGEERRKISRISVKPQECIWQQSVQQSVIQNV